MSTLDIPVDLVFTYVDGDDPAYVAKRRMYEQSFTPGNRHVLPAYRDDPVRYLNVGEIAYSVRSVLKYLPWVRTIFIVTDSQAPPVSTALIESGRVRVVDLNEFIPGEYLPTFNSIVIESFLHRIPGLSEVFLCSNDDYMHFSPVPRTVFCEADSGGKIRLNRYVHPAFMRRLQHGIARIIPMGGRLANLHVIGISNAYALLRSCHYRIPVKDIVIPRHVTHVARKSTAARIDVEFAEALDANRRYRFRNSTGFSYNTLLCTMEKVWNPGDRVYRSPLWDLSGQSEMFDFSGFTVFGNTEKLWRRVEKSKAQFACLNNIPKTDHGRFVEAMVRKGLGEPAHDDMN